MGHISVSVWREGLGWKTRSQTPPTYPFGYVGGGLMGRECSWRICRRPSTCPNGHVGVLVGRECLPGENTGKRDGHAETGMFVTCGEKDTLQMPCLKGGGGGEGVR